MAQDFEVFRNTASDGQIDRKARLENNKYISLELAIITTNQQKEGTAYILTLRQRHLALPTHGLALLRTPIPPPFDSEPPPTQPATINDENCLSRVQGPLTCSLLFGRRLLSREQQPSVRESRVRPYIGFIGIFGLLFRYVAYSVE